MPPAFSSPQIVLFCADIDRTVEFYRQLGFTEVFRTPRTGTPKHVDLVLDGFRLGFVSHDACREDHDLHSNRGDRRAAVILWCEDTAEAYRRVLEAGATPMRGPHRFLENLLIAWAIDPDGHPIQLVQRLAESSEGTAAPHGSESAVSDA